MPSAPALWLTTTSNGLMACCRPISARTACHQPRSRFALPMTRGDIADYLGLTIETVSRTLTKLRGEGLIEIPSSTEVIIRNREGLESLADGMT